MQWYREVFELSEPDPELAEGVVEFHLGPIWLHLVRGAEQRTAATVVAHFGVPDAETKHQRLTNLGLQVGPLSRVDGVVDYFDLADPDRNLLSFYSTLS